MIAEFYANVDVPPLDESTLVSRANEPIRTREQFAKAIIAHKEYKYVINHVAATFLAVKKYPNEILKLSNPKHWAV